MTEKCEDPNCPKHGALSTRGFRFQAEVVSDKMDKSVVVEKPMHRFVPKYNRYEKQTIRLTAHNPPCISAKKGDKVMVEECRPLSKTKNFVIVEKV
jgi:small subunit ribosomal protein S17